MRQFTELTMVNTLIDTSAKSRMAKKMEINRTKIAIKKMNNKALHFSSSERMNKAKLSSVANGKARVLSASERRFVFM